MVCALLVFLNMFETHTQAIQHYNKTRARDTKALTIQSQFRYVKFFTGFLYLKLGDPQDPDCRDWLRFALENYNLNKAKSWVTILEDMNKQEMDFHSICLGPFKKKVNSFDLKIIKLVRGEKKAKAGPKTVTVNFDVEEKHMGALNQDSLESVLEWQVVSDESGEDKYFLVIKLHSVDDIPNISGDFKIKFDSDGPKCKFYFWLNVAAIQYNEQLKEVTQRRS